MRNSASASSSFATRLLSPTASTKLVSARRSPERARYYYWTAPAHLRGLTPELVRTLERAGCYALLIGIESGSDRILKIMGKGITVDQIRAQVSLIKENSDILALGLFILGHPDEEERDIKATIKLATELPLDLAGFSNYIPLPGSRSHVILRYKGFLDDLDTDKLFNYDYPFTHPRIDQATLKKYMSRAYRRFYLRPKVILRLMRNINSFNQVKTILRRVASVFLG